MVSLPFNDCFLKKGLLNASSSNAEPQRKFTTRTLRNFGFGKESMESDIMDEVKMMVDWFKKQDGSAISGYRIFNLPVVNALLRIVSGKRIAWEDGKPTEAKLMDEYVK